MENNIQKCHILKPLYSSVKITGTVVNKVLNYIGKNPCAITKRAYVSQTYGKHLTSLSASYKKNYFIQFTLKGLKYNEHL